MKKQLVKELKKWSYKLAHVSSGFLVGITFPNSEGLALLGVLLFFLYEFLQYFRSVDWPISETREFAAGFFLVLTLLLLA